uniref:MFS domain-containing protein n=1 Tax=Syphacia muris TaxID=451379 RepID=A0A158R4J8_9BILA
MQTKSDKESSFDRRKGCIGEFIFSDSSVDVLTQQLRFRKPVGDISPLLDDKTDSTSTSTTLLPEAPDGGYGWVIVFVSFMIHFICDGISFSFGIIFSQIQEYFRTTTTMSGIIASIFLSLPLLLGPVAGVLTDIYDCKKVTIAGGLIAALGAFVSYFAWNKWQFLFTFGVIVSLGLCLCFNTAIVAVTYYFEKKRALATGIAVCGSGAGAAVFALFIEQLFTSFGWRITLLFIGMLLLLLVGCGLLIKDLEWPQDTLEYKRKKFFEKAARTKLSDLIGAQQVNRVYGDLRLRHAISLPQLSTFSNWCQQKTFTYGDKELKRSVNGDAFSRCRSDGAFLKRLDACDTFPSTDTLSPLHSSSTKPHKDLSMMPQCTAGFTECTTPSANIEKENEWISLISVSDENEWHNEKEQAKTNKKSEVDLVVKSTREVKEGRYLDATFGIDELSNREMNQEKQEKSYKVKPKGWSNTYSQSVVSLLEGDVLYPRFPSLYVAAQGRVPASNVITYGYRCYGFNNFNFRAPSAPVIFFRRRRKSRVINVSKVIESCNEWFSVVLSLLSVPSFSVYLFSSFLLYLFFDIPYVNFPEHATQHLNVTVKQASYLVSMIGVFNALSMIVCGLLADLGVMKDHLMQLYGGFIFMAGMCVLIAPFIGSYYVLMLLCAGFGFFISANYVLSSVLTVHLLCLYDFQTGYGLLCLVEGIGNLLGPALVGFVRDHQSSYHYIFIFGGLGTVISGLMVICIDIFLRCKQKYDKRKFNMKERMINDEGDVVPQFHEEGGV